MWPQRDGRSYVLLDTATTDTLVLDQSFFKSLLRLFRASHEVDTDSDNESIVAISGSEGSKSASESEQNEPPSSLASDAEQYERMQASYTAVGRDLRGVPRNQPRDF